MTEFSYQATTKDGKSVSGTLEASNKAGGVEALIKQGLKPITVKEQSKGLSVDFIIERIFGSKVKADALVVFTRQLSTMVGAGVPLLRSLDSLGRYTQDKVLKRALDGVQQDVRGGMSFADALQKHPNVFSDIYVNMVRAGEAAGIMDDILNRLAIQQEKASSIKKKVKGAMTYPIILLVITVIAFFGLMLFVIPQIGNILIDLGGPDAKLPLLTQVMLGLSSFMLTYWYILVVVFVGIFFGTSRFLRTARGKRLFHTSILRVPVIKNIVIKIAVARFSRTFASLMGAGVSVIEALSVTSGAIGNVAYKDVLDKSIGEIKNGKQLSETLAGSPLFPDIVSQMLAVGEETGKTDTVLLKVADFYEEEVDVVLESLSSIIEPLMIVIMGSMVGLIAASVMGPIASIAQNIKS